MILIYLLGFLILVKLFSSLFKRAVVNKKQIPIMSISEDETDLKTSIDMPKEISKNKWLHPTDGFGKLEEGVAGREKAAHKI